MIPLRRRDGTVSAYAMVDAADLAWLSQWGWSLSHGYAQRTEISGGTRTKVYMHRELLGLSKGDPLRCDHINMNGLDNRRANLRVVTKAENEQNRRSYKGAASRFRGVYRAAAGRWVAEARLDNTKHYLGTFDLETDAARVAAEWRAAHMPFSFEALSDPTRDKAAARTPDVDSRGTDGRRGEA